MTWRSSIGWLTAIALCACGSVVPAGELETTASTSGTTGAASTSSGTSSTTSSTTTTTTSSTSGSGALTPPYGFATATEYRPCASSSSCTAPEQCVSAGTFSDCQLPCTTMADCHDDEVCTDSHCLPNYCGPAVAENTANEYGPCTASDQGAGICVPFTDPLSGAATGICYTAGALGIAATCTPNAYQLWNPRAQLCAPPFLCSPTTIQMPWDGGLCVEACDPTGAGGAPTCPTATACTLIAGYDDPNLGLCL